MENIKREKLMDNAREAQRDEDYGSWKDGVDIQSERFNYVHQLSIEELREELMWAVEEDGYDLGDGFEEYISILYNRRNDG